MKIAINGRFLTANQVTGVERVADALTRHIPVFDKKNEYYLFAARMPKEYKFLKLISMPYTNKSFIWKHLQEQLLLPRLLKKHKIDLLLNFTNTGPVLYAPKSLTIIHCLHIFAYPKEYNLLFRLYYQWLIPNLVKYSKYIVTVSNHSKREIEHFTGKSLGKIQVISNGVDELFFRKATLNIRQKYAITKPYILFVGSFNPRKNVSVLVDAYLSSALKAKYDLVLVGNDVGSFASIPKAKAVRYITKVTDQELPAFYQQAKVFVFPSKHEGFGLPPLEAMAGGTPVILSDIPALREVGGKVAKYFNPESSIQLVELLEKTLKKVHTKQVFINQARKFLWSKAAAEYVKIYCK